MARQKPSPITTPPASVRTSLRAALAELDATHARLHPLAELRAWRERAARRYVRRASSTLPKSQA